MPASSQQILLVRVHFFTGSNVIATALPHAREGPTLKQTGGTFDDCAEQVAAQVTLLPHLGFESSRHRGPTTRIACSVSVSCTTRWAFNSFRPARESPTTYTATSAGLTRDD